MRKRLFKGGDHPDLALSLNNIAIALMCQGKNADAEAKYSADAYAMYRKRLRIAYKLGKSQRETL